MPTICRQQGYRVVIYPADHRPAHVHVFKDGCEAVFKLRCPSGPPELRESVGFSLKDLNRIQSALQDCIGQLCAAWRTIHGDY